MSYCPDAIPFGQGIKRKFRRTPLLVMLTCAPVSWTSWTRDWRDSCERRYNIDVPSAAKSFSKALRLWCSHQREHLPGLKRPSSSGDQTYTGICRRHQGLRRYGSAQGSPCVRVYTFSLHVNVAMQPLRHALCQLPDRLGTNE